MPPAVRDFAVKRKRDCVPVTEPFSTNGKKHAVTVMVLARELSGFVLAEGRGADGCRSRNSRTRAKAQGEDRVTAEEFPLHVMWPARAARLACSLDHFVHAHWM